jgi:sterol-4alpha-carboxylate 3-dehydrogenase (decarboxylating)
MDLLHRGRQNVQLGDDTALFEFLYVGNAADAHACAAKELLTGDEAVNIAGEAFFITDDQPMTWFAFARLVWAEAGSTSSPGKNTVIPFWLLSALASVWEWLCWTTTLGRKPASGFTRYNIDVLRRGNNTLDIQKAKDRLGYVPRITREEGVRRAVRAYSTM